LAIRLLIFLLSVGLTFGIEVGKVEIREQDILIPVKTYAPITLEVLNPPKVPKSGPNTDPKGYAKVYRYIYLSLCYGDMYYRDESKNVYGSLSFEGSKGFVQPSALPKRGEFRLLPARLCLCFSDEERQKIDVYNAPMDDVCSLGVPIWINYTHEEVLKEVGIEQAELKVRVKAAPNSYAEFRIKISR